MNAERKKGAGGGRQRGIATTDFESGKAMNNNGFFSRLLVMEMPADKRSLSANEPVNSSFECCAW